MMPCVEAPYTYRDYSPECVEGEFSEAQLPLYVVLEKVGAAFSWWVSGLPWN